MDQAIEQKRKRSRIRMEVDELVKRYKFVRYDKLDSTWVFIDQFPLPWGWNTNHVQIMIDIPSGPAPACYPFVAPQWFWTNHDLRTRSGQAIGHFFTQGSSHVDKQHLDKGWGHFCVHLNSWQPKGGFEDWQKGHSLLTYLDLISTIFRDRKNLTSGT